MPVTDYVAAASSCNRVLSDCAAGKGSPTSNFVVNSSSNKSSVTALATSSTISSLSSQLHAMLDGSAGESYWFVKKHCMYIRAASSSFTTTDMKFVSFSHQFFATYKCHYLAKHFFVFLPTVFLVSEMNDGISNKFFNAQIEHYFSPPSGVHERGIKETNLRFLLCCVGYSMRELISFCSSLDSAFSVM